MPSPAGQFDGRPLEGEAGPIGILLLVGFTVIGCGGGGVGPLNGSEAPLELSAVQADLNAHGSAEMQWISRVDRVFAPTTEGRAAFEAFVAGRWLPWPKFADMRTELQSGSCVWNAGPASSFEWGSWLPSTVLKLEGSPVDSLNTSGVEVVCPGG